MNIRVEALPGNFVSLNQGGAHPLHLHDNGNGGKQHNQKRPIVTACVVMPDPDLMTGDGIYSRYLTRYPSPGMYRVVVIMKNTARSAYTVAGQEQLYPQPSGYLTPSCCGSVIRVPSHRRRYLGYFSREVAMDVFINNIEQVEVGLFPPARIVDLIIEEYQDCEILVSWTAPGDDLLTRSVESYLVTIFTEIDKAVLGSEAGHTITIVNIAHEGDRLFHKLDLRNLTNQAIIGVRAVDADGNMGKISNLVEVKLHENLTKCDMDTVNDITDDNDKVINIALACLILLAVIMIIPMILMLRRKAISPSVTKTKSHGVTAILSSTDHSTQGLSSFGLQSCQFSY